MVTPGKFRSNLIRNTEVIDTSQLFISTNKVTFILKKARNSFAVISEMTQVWKTGPAPNRSKPVLNRIRPHEMMGNSHK